MYKIQIEIENSFGKFRTGESTINKEGYDELINMSRTFYITGGFEITCEDGTFIVFPPEIVKNSILKIYANKIE